MGKIGRQQALDFSKDASPLTVASPKVESVCWGRNIPATDETIFWYIPGGISAVSAVAVRSKTKLR